VSRPAICALRFVIDCNLLAKFEADFSFVPGGDLYPAILLRGDGQRLVGDGFYLFIADIGAVVIITHAQMLAAIVTG